MNCLDAETLAAWMDGGLKGAALEDVQAHVAGCERCQILLGAMGRTRAAVPPTEARPVSRRWLAWAVPLTAAAAAIAIWVAIPEQRTATAPPARQTTAATPEIASPPSLPATTPPSAGPRVAPAPAAKAERSNDIAQLTPDAAITESARPPLAAQPAEPGDIRSPARDAISGEPVAAPSAPKARAEERNAAALCGPPPPAGTAGQLTAGSPGAGGVCWVVGRGGLVFRSGDGRTWQRINFPEMSDLTAVMATDSSNAAITDAEGRTFRTTDGGMSWTLK